MPEIKIINPDALGKPLGQYSHMTRVKASEFLFIAGQVGVRQRRQIGWRGFRCAMRADLRQYRGGAEIARRGLGQCRRVHDLSRALAGYPEIHEIPAARISQDVCQRRLSAQHAADDRPAGAGAAADRSVGGGGAIALLNERPAPPLGGVFDERQEAVEPVHELAVGQAQKQRRAPRRDGRRATGPWRRCRAGSSAAKPVRLVRNSMAMKAVSMPVRAGR